MSGDSPTGKSVCDHFFVHHVLGGHPVSVALCQFCHEPNWADLREQISSQYDSMYTYVHRTAPVDTIAEAWRVLSDPDQSAGKGNRFLDEIDYIEDDWSKTAKRIIKGYAEANERPSRWPWTDNRFDIFDWMVAG